MTTSSKIYACVTDSGTAMPETALTESEYANPAIRAAAERIALGASDCTRIEWHDVTGNEAVCPRGEH